MQKDNIYKIINIILIIAMFFGWGSMLAKILLSDYYEFLQYNPASYGFLILLFATLVYTIVSSRKVFNEWLSIGMIIFGMFSLCQPFTIVLYKCGFQTLVAGTIGFIVTSHK
ncbi:MAG: hypothetical protein ACPL7B_08945 [Candidatus Poribacteria bacterium]